MSTIYDRMKKNNILTWFSDMLQLTNSDTVKVPNTYKEQVVAVKNLLTNDQSGLINTVLDFAINCALVEYTVEVENDNLKKILNSWLDNINFEIRGKVPVGVDALAKEYFRERWKGSSLLLLRTSWEEVGGYYLPTRLWFVDGEDVLVEDDSPDGLRRIGDEDYFLTALNSEGTPSKYKLPRASNEKYFVQKPFSSWSSLYTTPYLIQKGLYKNAKMLELVVKKGEQVVAKALEYLMLLKKGTENLALSSNPDFIYSNDDIQKVEQELTEFLNAKKTTQGTPAYVTNFDTEIEHLIPEYSKILKQELYTPIERRILAGLGLVEIVEGVSSTRKESLLNPKPLVAEVDNGIAGFKQLLTDILVTIVEVNREKHKKYFSKRGSSKISIYNTPVTQFINKEAKQMLRSVYDRGGLSRQTLVEVVGELDYKVEKDRRKAELDNGDMELMYPQVIQNLEKEANIKDFEDTPEGDPDSTKNIEDENKSKTEKFNYNNS